MRCVEWYVAKVDKREIDLWEKFSSRKAAERYVKKDGSDTPFVVVKSTLEIVVSGNRRPKPATSNR